MKYTQASTTIRRLRQCGTRSPKQFQYTKVRAQLKVINSLTSYENFKAPDSEMLESTYTHYRLLLNYLSKILKQPLANLTSKMMTVITKLITNN